MSVGGSWVAPGEPCGSCRIAARIKRLALLSASGARLDVMLFPLLFGFGSFLERFLGNAFDGSALPCVDDPPDLEIVCACPKSGRVVVEVAEAHVASAAEEASELAVAVRMIDLQLFSRLSAAARAHVVLPS